MSLWFAITSDSNPCLKMGKTRRQKDGWSSYWVKFTWAWITLYPCFSRNIVRFSALFLQKEEKSSFYHTNSHLWFFRRVFVVHKVDIGLKFSQILNPQCNDYSSLNRKWVINWGGAYLLKISAPFKTLCTSSSD